MDKYKGIDAGVMKGYFKGAHPRLLSIADVEAWAQQNGGEQAVHVALKEGNFGHDQDTAAAWLDVRERNRLITHEQATLLAAQRSARYAMWGAVVSVVSAIVSVAAYWLTRVPG